jgi:hypothetical protein
MDAGRIVNNCKQKWEDFFVEEEAGFVQQRLRVLSGKATGPLERG